MIDSSIIIDCYQKLFLSFYKLHVHALIQCLTKFVCNGFIESLYHSLCIFYNRQQNTTVFLDTRLSKSKHPRKRFQNFRQSCVLSTDRIEIHQSQPLVWPSDLVYVMLAGCDWWISIRSVDIMYDWRKFWKCFRGWFWFRKSRIKENGGNKNRNRNSSANFNTLGLTSFFATLKHWKKLRPE